MKAGGLLLLGKYLRREKSLAVHGQLLSCTLLAVHAAGDHIGHGAGNADDVGNGPGDVEANLRIGDIGHADECVPAAGDHGHPGPLCLAVFKHPHGDAHQGEQSQGLVGPGEVAPQDHEAVGVDLGPNQNGDDQDEDGQSQTDTLAVGGLVDVHGLGQAQTQSTQSRIAGGDGQNDNAQQSDDAAHMAQQVLTNHTHSAGGQIGLGALKGQVVNAHSAGSPNHGDEAFQHHHVIEGVAALLLALHSAGDDGRLSGMEAGKDAAGHRHEEDGQEVAVCKVICVSKGITGAGNSQDGGGPIIPDVQQGEALDKDADEHADGGEQQDAAEDGVDLADNGIDGEHGGDQVVQEDGAIDDPRGNRGGLAVKAEQLRGGNVAGGVDKHRAHQQKHDAHKNIIELINALGGIAADHLGHLGAAVTQADHAGEIVVHSAADDVADGNGQKCDGPEQNALDGPDDGAGTGNVQQVNQAVLPALHGDKVHAVFLGVGGGLAIIRTEHLFTEATVQCGTADQDDQANNECSHKNTLLCKSDILFFTFFDIRIVKI